MPLWRGIAYSGVVGFVSSFLGIGGGVIHVPLLGRVLGFPTHIATATSHFVLAIIAGGGAATHVVASSFAHGNGIRRAIALSVGVMLGAQLGARLSLRTSGRTVEVLLGVALVALAARLVFVAF
ncbi:MAG: TSUP family transporter [Gaiellaceae bacterium]